MPVPIGSRATRSLERGGTGASRESGTAENGAGDAGNTGTAVDAEGAETARSGLGGRARVVGAVRPVATVS